MKRPWCSPFGKMTKHELNADCTGTSPWPSPSRKSAPPRCIPWNLDTARHRRAATSQSAQYTDVQDEAIMITGDSNIVQVEAMYQYVVNDAEAFLFQVDDPYGTLQLAFETVLRRNIQNKTVDDALLKKQTIGIEVQPEFQQVVNDYRLGVTIKKVEIQNTKVPQEVESAFQDVINAMNEKTQKLEEAERYENEVLPAARADAYKMVQDAEGFTRPRRSPRPPATWRISRRSTPNTY